MKDSNKWKILGLIFACFGIVCSSFIVQYCIEHPNPVLFVIAFVVFSISTLMAGYCLGASANYNGLVVKYCEIKNATYIISGYVDEITILMEVDDSGKLKYYSILEFPNRKIPVGTMIKKVGKTVILF